MSIAKWKEDMLHGGDYNPDQWLDRPDILEKDIELMKKAHVNSVSLGIFAWAALEPAEGRYHLEWMQDIIDRLYENGINVILSTPSGSRPVWMACQYPEVLRVDNNLARIHMGVRENHCYTSPIYRKKVWDINKKLSERFGSHPGVIMWHVSNEYSGACYCPLCQAEFRNWLKKKYKTLDNLNHEWWTAFWSHTYQDWEQIEPPLPNGERDTMGLQLDWNRFVTDRTVDFCKWEIAAIRAGGSELPTTINMMGFYDGLNYNKFKDVIDVSSWDNYPVWHMGETEEDAALFAAASHDYMRSVKHEPWLLMESTPHGLNWMSVSKLKKPGMHMLSSMQAVAHGSDSVQYFQWRKGRGGGEKFHGAVVDHYGESDTRVFKEVTEVGKRLEALKELCYAGNDAQAAILFDHEIRWALDAAQGPRNSGIHYLEHMLDIYYAFWRMGINVDFIDCEVTAEELSHYKIVAAPMLYLYRDNIDKKLADYTAQGGTLVGGYLSGVVDENDLCYLGKTPHTLYEVYGIRTEEIDGLYDHQKNCMTWEGKQYELRELCEVVKQESDDLEILASYESDYYKGRIALAAHVFGKGKAYFIAAKAGRDFYQDFYGKLAKEYNLSSFDGELPKLVEACVRTKGEKEYLILNNYDTKEVSVELPDTYKELETGRKVERTISLSVYGTAFLMKESRF